MNCAIVQPQKNWLPDLCGTWRAFNAAVCAVAQMAARQPVTKTAQNDFALITRNRSHQTIGNEIVRGAIRVPARAKTVRRPVDVVAYNVVSLHVELATSQ